MAHRRMAMKCLCLLLSISVFSRTAAQTETYTWGNVAMGGGGFVSGIITDKTQQGIVYARTDVGGAYRWNSAADRWTPLLDWVSQDQTGYMGVESIALDPNIPGRVYLMVGTSYFNNGNSAILRSDNYGAAFSITDVTSKFKVNGNGMGRQTGERLAVDPNLGSILFCGTRENGLFKSADAGATWNNIPALAVTTTTSGNGICFVLFDPSSGSNGNATQTFITGVSRTGVNLYRTDDGGVSFTAISGAPAGLMPQRAVISSDHNLYVTYANAEGPWNITGAGQIWKYNLITKVWKNVTPQTFSGAYGGISIDAQNPLRLVASSINTYALQYGSAYGDRIFLSTDGGENWTDVIARGFKLDDQGISWINGNAIHWAGDVEFDPFDTKKAWVISGNGVFHSDNIDSAVNVWKFKVKGMEETVPQDMAVIGNGPVLSAISDFDGFRQTDVSQYSAINAPVMGTTTSIAFASLNPKIGLRVGAKMYYSTDTGLTWTQCSINGTQGTVAVSADGKIFLHCPAGSGVTYRSTDLGTSWSAINALNVTDAKPVADQVNPQKFYIYNPSTGTVRISTNGGQSFSSSGNAGTGGSKIIRSHKYAEGDIWVALYNGGLSHSEDSGKTFNVIAGVTACDAVGLGKAAPGQTYPAVFIWGSINGITGVFRSIDKGASWVRVNDDAHQYGGPANGQFVIGDWNIYGRVYMSSAGRGIVYGESSKSCAPDFITPGIKINKASVVSGTLASLNKNDTLVLSPQSPGTGNWSWTGPGGFVSADREVVLDAIQPDQSGVYTVSFTNTQGCASAPMQFSVTVSGLVQQIIVAGAGNQNTIDSKSGTLQLSAQVSPSGTTSAVTWSISQNPALASIDDTGLLTALDDGEVTVRATATDGSGIYGELTITITQQRVTVGLPAEKLSASIHPNPSENRFTVDLPPGSLKIEIITSQGMVVFTRMVSASEQQVELQTAMFPGVYITRLYTANGVINLRTIVR